MKKKSQPPFHFAEKLAVIRGEHSLIQGLSVVLASQFARSYLSWQSPILIIAFHLFFSLLVPSVLPKMFSLAYHRCRHMEICLGMEIWKLKQKSLHTFEESMRQAFDSRVVAKSWFD